LHKNSPKSPGGFFSFDKKTRLGHQASFFTHLAIMLKKQTTKQKVKMMNIKNTTTKGLNQGRIEQTRELDVDKNKTRKLEGGEAESKEIIKLKCIINDVHETSHNEDGKVKKRIEERKIEFYATLQLNKVSTLTLIAACTIVAITYCYATYLNQNQNA